MKRTFRSTPGFTLIELLVVMAIIAILAATLLSALAAAKTKAKVRAAQIEMGQLAMAIRNYESAYGRFPCSARALASATALSEDFTYGTGGIAPLKGPNGPVAVLSPGNYQTNNAEVVALLLDLETYGDGRPTINQGHVKNSQKTRFLDSKFSGDTSSPGVGLDGVYRDPWGNPYIITLDLNYDEKARDGFYRTQAVSENSAVPANPKPGLNGLIARTFPNGAVVYENNSPVMVWSAGPDKTIDPTAKANQGANRDNIISWK